MNEKTQQTTVKVRPKRTPISKRNILSVEGKDPNYHYRIVNDTGDRIQAFKDAGYETVPASDVRIGDKRINSATPEGSLAQVSVGGGQKALLMRIPKEWYEEDQAAKQTEINRLEQSTLQQALERNELKTGKLEVTRN